jgi:hypothetical protein
VLEHRVIERVEHAEEQPGRHAFAQPVQRDGDLPLVF